MKRALSLSLLALFLLFTACQNDGPITGPETPTSAKVSKAEPKWIMLPQKADQSLQKIFHTSKYITVAEGGFLSIDEKYETADGKKFKATSLIEFAPNIVQADCEITMDIDDQTGVSTFLPHQMFNGYAILNQSFSGLDLTGVNPDNVKLYYLATDGNYEVMQNDGITVDVATGTITVVNGLIPHFSVYGFGE